MELEPNKKSDIGKDQNKGVFSLESPASSSKEKQDTVTHKEESPDVIQNQPRRATPQEKGILGSTVRRIRTYKEDIASTVRSQKASLTSITAAEQERRTHIPKKVPSKINVNTKKIAIISGGIIFILLSIGIIGFVPFFSEKEGVVIEQEIPSFIFVEAQRGIDMTGKSAREILQTLGVLKNTVSLSLGQIVHLYLTNTTQEADIKTTRIISAREFLTNINAQVSAAFLRSLEPSFMLGVHVFNRNQPFIIFKSNSYQNSFRGLLEWERTMSRDLFLFIGRKVDPVLGVPINPQTGAPIILRENFEDKIIQNTDVRVLMSEAGTVELLYAFPNQQTLIITTNENTLVEIITRLNSVRVF